MYDRMLLSPKRKIFVSILMRWMNLEPSMHGEVTQKEKNKCHILTHIYMGSRKMVLINLFSGLRWRHRHREQTCGPSRGRRGRGELRELY